MAWKYEDSLARIQLHLNSIGELEVSKLTREADLENLLSETTCRDIYGAHVYVQVSNFARLVSDGVYAQDDYKRLIRSVHIYQRELTRIVEGLGGIVVHFQGTKLHTLFYRPIDDSKKLAVRAVILQLVLKDFVRNVFNLAFPGYDDFTIASGTDIGNAIGTSNGINGDRELLFLGAPANHAAKIISTAGRLRLTQNIYNALPHNLQQYCDKTMDGTYQLKTVTSEELDTLLDTYSLIWNRNMSARRIDEDKKCFLLNAITYSSAKTSIDLDTLSIYNNKRVLAASIFADVSGFTAYIDSAKSEQDKKAALRVFHAIRKELARVIKGDFNGLRIQYQGDRIQGLFHLPQDNKEAIATKVTEAAVGLQSSMEYTLKRCLPEVGELRLAIGIDLDTTLVSKLGARGQRDRICVGEPVERAALYEERCKGGQIGVSRSIYDILPTHLRDFFVYNATAQCYSATDLTEQKVERAVSASLYRSGAPVYIQTSIAGVHISSQESPTARKHVPAKPYSES